MPRRSDVGSNQALISPEVPTPPLVLLSAEDLFTKFMKLFMETTQAWDQEQLKLRERPLKPKILELHSEKSHMDSYHFCQ